jgi:hypothetical protein
LIFRKAWSSSFCRSAKETSKILPFNASLAFLRPVVLLTRVFPTLQIVLDHIILRGRYLSYSLVANEDGAWYLISHCTQFYYSQCAIP